MQHRMERRYFRVHGMLLLLSHEKYRRPCLLVPPSLFHHEKKGGQYGEILLPTFRKKREGCLFHYKLKIKRKARNLSYWFHTSPFWNRSECVSFMKWLSKCKKERKITQGGKGTAGGGSSGIENENKKFFFIPCMIIWAITHIFSLEEEKKE